MGVWNFNLRSSQTQFFSVFTSTRRWFRIFFIYPASTQQPKKMFFGRKDIGEATPKLSLGLYIALQQMLYQYTLLGLANTHSLYKVYGMSFIRTPHLASLCPKSTN
jgi:hypothetical protein